MKILKKKKRNKEKQTFFSRRLENHPRRQGWVSSRHESPTLRSG